MTEPNSQPSQTASTSATSSPAPTKPETAQESTEAKASPLGDPGPDSITELFNRYPELPEDKLKAVVAHLRATRGKIGQDQKPVKEAKAKAAPKGPTKKLSAEELAALLDEEF